MLYVSSYFYITLKTERNFLYSCEFRCIIHGCDRVCLLIREGAANRGWEVLLTFFDGSFDYLLVFPIGSNSSSSNDDRRIYKRFVDDWNFSYVSVDERTEF